MSNNFPPRIWVDRLGEVFEEEVPGDAYISEAQHQSNTERGKG